MAPLRDSRAGAGQDKGQPGTHLALPALGTPASGTGWQGDRGGRGTGMELGQGWQGDRDGIGTGVAGAVPALGLSLNLGCPELGLC